MIRTKGEAGSGSVVEAVRHMRAIVSQMKKLTTMRDDELMREAKELGAPLELIRQIAKTGKLPVPNFSAGGIATPADAALVRRLGADTVFVRARIFKSSDPDVGAAGRGHGGSAHSRSSRGLRRFDSAGWREHDAIAVLAGRRLGGRDREIRGAGWSYIRDVRRSYTTRYRSAESDAGFLETAGYDRDAECLRAPHRERR